MSARSKNGTDDLAKRSHSAVVNCTSWSTSREHLVVLPGEKDADLVGERLDALTAAG